jgi:hypothetical protein
MEEPDGGRQVARYKGRIGTNLGLGDRLRRARAMGDGFLRKLWMAAGGVGYMHVACRLHLHLLLELD